MLSTKYKNTLKLIQKNKQSRTKITKYSRIHKLNSDNQYAMIFKKNDKTSFFLRQLTLDNENVCALNLSLFLEHKHFPILNTQVQHIFSTYNFLSVTPGLQTLNNHISRLNVNFTRYINHISELFFSQSFLGTTHIVNPYNKLNFNNKQSTYSNSSIPFGLSIDPKEINKQSTTSYTIIMSPKLLLNNYNLLLLNNYTLESQFIRPKSVASKNAVFILAKAPSYRMGTGAQAPISTNQYYGNLYSQYSCFSSSPSPTSLTTFDSQNPLLTKASVSASVISLLKPYKNKTNRNVLNSLSNKIKSSSLKSLNKMYSNLLYVPTSITVPLVSKLSTSTSQNTHESTNKTRSYVNLHRAINLKNKPTSRYSFKKTQQNTTQALNNPRFIEDAHLVSKIKKSLWLQRARIAYKKLNRFSK